LPNSPQERPNWLVPNRARTGHYLSRNTSREKDETNNFQQLPTISNKKFTKKKEKWKMSHNPESWQIDKCDGAKISAELY
jgi:hypothetical protein